VGHVRHGPMCGRPDGTLWPVTAFGVKLDGTRGTALEGKVRRDRETYARRRGIAVDYVDNVSFTGDFSGTHQSARAAPSRNKGANSTSRREAEGSNADCLWARVGRCSAASR